MFFLLLASAIAQELPYEEVKPVAEPSGGVLDADEVWVRTDSGCLSATRDATTWSIALCARTDPSGRTLSCTAAIDRATAFSGPRTRCVWSDDPDSGWTLPTALDDPPVLVQVDEDRAIWRRTFRLRPIAYRSIATVGTCTRESLDALGEEAPEGAVRRCFTTEETRYVRVGDPWSAGIGMFDSDGEVDCREPCPADPRQAWLDEEASRLAPSRFADPEAPTLALYRTRALCEASSEPPLWKPGGECLD